ncbi:PRELI domain-containing protein 1, mitochondrial-like isoform X2 [Oscarella lobularis]|uniref:PRELI domain-containing protein 1, mitochondrial-like isoform X2 n=1 Tax=Oscarella lobularis TaxID=121494 RepID=UPI0033134897
MASFQGKFYSSVHTVKNRWDQVTTALWKRYPNPMAKHVLWEDTISRELDDGKLKSKRLFGKTNRLPQWGKRFVSGSTTEAVVLEESIVDPDEETRKVHLLSKSREQRMDLLQTTSMDQLQCVWVFESPAGIWADEIQR